MTNHLKPLTLSVLRSFSEVEYIEGSSWRIEGICVQNPFPKHYCIGIWGFGRVGKSVAHTFTQLGYTIAIMDSNRNITADNFFHETEHDTFFASCDIVIPSPGIDTRKCAPHNHPFFAELDLFQTLWHKPIIAITGSVGKTTITSMLTHLFKHNNFDVVVGGNIGTAACDLLEKKDTTTHALLEVSSFQLEYCATFAPHIAVITNLHANHLDRHATIKKYWKAKTHIFAHQKEGDHLIAPLELRKKIQAHNPRATTWYTSTQKPSEKEVTALTEHERLICLEENVIQVYIEQRYQTFIKPEQLFSTTFSENALLLWATIYLFTNNTLKKTFFDCDYASQEHRLEYVATINGITCINDSKATTIASTLAAVKKYAHKPIVLLLGGLSKGADRESLIKALPPYVQHVACFGKEAQQLHDWCTKYTIKSSAFKTLEPAFTATLSHAPPNSTLLLSPSGSSFDLYKNYEERGAHFKKLVLKQQGILHSPT